MAHQARAATSAHREADSLADGIATLLEQMRQMKREGFAIQPPERLTRMCREFVAEADAPLGRASTPGLDEPIDRSLRDLPLRRLLWQVIEVDEVFSVSDVVDRLAARGLAIEPGKVSNALGYWVERSRLVRLQKGVYRYPPELADDARPIHPDTETAPPADDFPAATRRVG